MESNVQKMIAIIGEIKTIAQFALDAQSLGNDNIGQLWDIIEKCDSGLSLPLLNCNVGTADEQDSRMTHYCQTRKCNDCPLWDNVNNGVRCEFTWSQMPYEKGGADE